MSESAAAFFRRNGFRFALTGLLGVWLSGCSADSARLSDSLNAPFSNPFSTASNDAAPMPRVSSTPLAPVPNNSSYAVVARPSPVAVSSVPTPEPATTARIASAPVSGSSAGWSAVGGSPVVVSQGDSADTLSRRYGVPTAALLSANGLSSSSQIHGGMHIVIPVYSAGAHSSVKPARDVAEVAPARVKPVKADKANIASATASEPSATKIKDKVGKTDAPSKQDKLAKAESQLKPDAKTAPQTAKLDPLKAAKPAKPTVDPTPTGRAAPEAPTSGAPQTAAQADAAGASPEFRWPAHGHIIQGFKTGGNDGINIAVPEGTSVRAAENGVVAYAGDGLKGYGNLVLIKHPNGFVSAYANNGELNVKLGETVKRGQVIAKSGSSGNVSSPQLHFELRKGSTPVDPTNYLAGL